jgi:hypothetical protein
MKEEFLHYLWKYGLYDPDSLIDNDNNEIVVIHPGEYNRDSGPDFFNARINIAGTEWAGNVEIHTRASHFISHGHNRDHAFDNVILHVVAENDRKVFSAAGTELLTVGIRFDPDYYRKYTDLVNHPYAIACQNDIRKIDKFILRSWLNSLVIERLQDKSSAIRKIFSETGHDWEETFYRILSRYFGFRVNAEPFEMLAGSMPFKLILKHADNRFQVEALLFGTAGMLEEGLFKGAISDDYYRELIKEYKILSAKYSLKPIHGWLWKFSRLRPVNFPTIRISQLAAMLSTAGGLFSKILEATDIIQLNDLMVVKASSYWDDHYIFGKKSKRKVKNAGSLATEILLINAVIPVLFFYGQVTSRAEICERALSFLDIIKAEVNSITEDWALSGFVAYSALDSQALLQLMYEYCKKRRCLDCRIGAKIIGSGKNLKNRDELILEP